MCMGSQPSGGGQTSTAGAAVGGAATGASMGAMLGPWGAAVGAVGGAVMGTLGSIAGNKAAKTTEENRRIAQDNAMVENRRRATVDYLHAIRLENLQAAEEHAALAEKSVDLSRQTDATIGTAVASAAERGVGGRSLEQIMSDYHAQNNLEIGRLRTNQGMKDHQHSENIAGADQQYWNRVTGMQPYQKQPVAPVDYFSPVFSLVGNLGKIAMANEVGKVPSGQPLPAAGTTNASVGGYATDTLDG